LAGRDGFSADGGGVGSVVSFIGAAIKITQLGRELPSIGCAQKFAIFL
jgi:hypothetical protein